MKVTLLTHKQKPKNAFAIINNKLLENFPEKFSKSREILKLTCITLSLVISSFSVQAQPNCPIDAGTNVGGQLQFGLVDQFDCIDYAGQLIEVIHPGGLGLYLVNNCLGFGQADFIGGDQIPPSTPLTGSLNFGALGLSCSYSTGVPYSGTPTIECNCLDNETAGGPVGQFTGQYVVTSGANEFWEISNPVNVYSNLQVNPAPPQTIGDGFLVTEVPVNPNTSNYIFDFLFLDGENFSFRIQNQADPLNIGFNYAGPPQGCAYPNIAIDGDDFVCPEATEAYSVASIPQASYGWSLNSGGNFAGPTDGPVVQVDWSDQDGGPHILSVTVNTFHGCEETVFLPVVIEDVIALACNNNINLSMDANCEVMVTPDMILEDPQYEDDSYTIQLKDIAADTLVPNGIINGTYVGVLLEAKVTQMCSGNSCWGFITVEDKTVPDLQCEDVTIHCSESTLPSNTGLPLPPESNYIDNGDGTWTVLDFDACGESILNYYDDVTNLNCVGLYSAIITRTWKLTDGSGTMTTCEQTIYTELASLDELGLPPNYDGTQEEPFSCADKDQPDGWISLPNGHPSPETTGSPQGPTCLNLVVDYTDQKVDKCGDYAFHIIRQWTIWDICTNDYKTYNQNIKVLDTEGPLCVAPNEFNAYTEPGECSVNIDVPPPTVIFDCSGWEYTVKYKLRDESGNPFLFPIDDNVIYTGGGYTILDIPFETDSVWIVYYLVDDCNNTTECFTEVALHDLEEPVAVCDQHTTVSVGEDGCGYANVWSFDDGSWDNCMLDYMEARRMEDTSCGIVNGWTQNVKFCCEDIGTTVMVQLRVVDIFGNSNNCMVEVEVQDNIPPKLVSCPGDRTVNCGTDLNGDLSQYGIPVFSDNCDVTIHEDVTRSLNNCGTGTVVRTFKGTDPSGRYTTCVQTIHVEALDPFYINSSNPNDGRDDVNWPRDVVINGCVDSGTDPDDLPSNAQRPVIFETECSMVAMDYDDVVFQIVEDACFKILRQWTIIDWCQFDQHNPGAGGIWYYTQVIKVQNSSPPVFSRGCEDETIEGTPVDGCQASITLDAWADDDCTPEADLVWYYEVDLNNNGSIEYSGNSNNASRTYPFGTHKVTWSVTDQCGNVSSCMKIFTITDSKPPTPICLGGLVLVLMESTGSVTIWASDFIKDALDNCSDEPDIDVSFSSSTSDTYRTFDCDDIEGGVVDTFELQIWLTDEAGNQDFCTVELIVQDNSNACPNTGASAFAQVSGAVYTEDEQMIDDVEVTLDADMAEFPISIMSEDGYFAFSNLFMYEDYSIEPWKDDSHLLGVSTLDLVLIQKHILGITPLNSPYKIIAADANNSEEVTALDLVQLRKLILGLIDELPENNSWRFVDSDFVFEDLSNPFPFVESIQLNQLDHDVSAADFIAVKIGDVNATISELGSSGVDNRSKTTVSTTERVFAIGEELSVALSIDQEAAVLGMQFSLEFDASKLSFVGYGSNGFQLDEDNIALQDLEAGLIHFSLSQGEAQKMRASSDLFSLNFIAVSEGQLSASLKLSKNDLIPEIYTQHADHVKTSKLALEFRNGNGTFTDKQEFALYQNVPNPFDNETVIGFVLPKAGVAKLKMFDVNGRLIQEISNEYAQGYNEVTIDVDDYNYTGILYYQLETETHSANKKMIVIK